MGGCLGAGECLCCAYECVNMSVVKIIGRCINCKILQSMLIPVLPLVCENKNHYIKKRYIYAGVNSKQ